MKNKTYEAMPVRRVYIPKADGKKKYKGNDKGTPQGGVISPLLANIYLNVLDTIG